MYLSIVKSFKQLSIAGLAFLLCMVSGYAAADRPVVQSAEGKLDTAAFISPENGLVLNYLYGYSFRFDWGYRTGQWRLTLTWGGFSPTSKVLVSISEADVNGRPFVGNARYTVNNVAPGDGYATIWVTIEWPSPIHLVANYVVLP